MKKLFQNFNWRLYSILLVVSVFSIVASLPYVFTIQQEQLAATNMPMPAIIAISILQSSLLFAILLFISLKLCQKVGFGLPILENKLNQKLWPSNIKSLIQKSISWGILVGLLIILADYIFSVLGLKISLSNEINIEWWKGFLVSFYGGIGEEILLRLFLMTFVIWLLNKIFKSQNPATSRQNLVWSAIIITSIIFGLGHLPITASMTNITFGVVTRAIVLNGIGGIVFGWLYWKKGLESAIIAHFTADIVLHLLFPLLLKI